MEVFFVKLRESCKNAFLRSGIYDLVGPTHFFKKVRDATEYLKRGDQANVPTFASTPPGTSPPRDVIHPIGTPNREENEWTVPNKRESFASGSYFASYMEDEELEHRARSRGGAFGTGRQSDDFDDNMIITVGRARQGIASRGGHSLAALFDEGSAVELTDSEGENRFEGATDRDQDADSSDTIRAAAVNKG